MKKKIIAALLALVLAVPVVTIAQDKNRKQELKKELSEKASKDARKEAKEYKKQGFKVSPGALPLEKQLDRAYLMEIDTYDDGLPKYFINVGQSVGQTYDAAAQQAKMIARQNIAADVEADVTTLIDVSVANNQLTSSEAESVTKSLSKSKGFISKNMQNLITVLECYRTLKNGNVEVVVRIAYPRGAAMRSVKNEIKQNLEEEIEDFDNKFNLE